MRRTDRCVPLERHLVFRFDHALRSRERRVRLALDLCFIRGGGFGAAHVVEELVRRREGRRVRLLPLCLQLQRRADGLLLALAHHGNIVAAADHAQETGHVLDGRFVHALQRGAGNRRPHVARVHHAGQLHVDGPLERAVHFRGNVVTLDRLADHAQLVHRLHRRLARGRVDVATFERHVETLAADELGVGHLLRGIGFRRDGCVRNCKLIHRHAQVLAAELEQHAPRLRRHAPHRPAIGLDGIGTARAALVGRDVRAAHDQARVVVRDVQLVAHHLAERGARALAAVGLAHVERGGVVRVDHDPRVELAEIRIRPRACAHGRRGRRRDCGLGANRFCERQCAHGDGNHQRARAFEEVAPRGGGEHRVLDGLRQVQRAAAHVAAPAGLPPFT